MLYLDELSSAEKYLKDLKQARNVLSSPNIILEQISRVHELNDEFNKYTESYLESLKEEKLYLYGGEKK